MLKKTFYILLMSVISSPLLANTYMDVNWAKQACDAWNKSSTLTELLVDVDKNEEGGGYNWIKNNAGRGYKLVQMYRSSCGEASKVQLLIQQKGDKAMCVAAGKPDGKKMNFAVDYMMHASDKNWACMGKGSFGCGAMGAMMSGKLKFKGPKGEAMRVMGPFGAFLKIAGRVPGDKGSCPK